jgi:hypothetical protein
MPRRLWPMIAFQLYPTRRSGDPKTPRAPTAERVRAVPAASQSKVSRVRAVWCDRDALLQRTRKRASRASWLTLLTSGFTARTASANNDCPCMASLEVLPRAAGLRSRLGLWPSARRPAPANVASGRNSGRARAVWRRRRAAVSMRSAAADCSCATRREIVAAAFDAASFEGGFRREP